jgi:hypothetical protein
VQVLEPGRSQLLVLGPEPALEPRLWPVVVLRCGMSACDQTLVKAQTEMALAAKTVALMRMENTPERKIPASGPADAAVVPNHEPRPTLFIAPTDFQGERWQG